MLTLIFTINAVFKWRILSFGSKSTFGNCRFDDKLILFEWILFFFSSRSSPSLDCSFSHFSFSLLRNILYNLHRINRVDRCFRIFSKEFDGNFIEKIDLLRFSNEFFSRKCSNKKTKRCHCFSILLVLHNRKEKVCVSK